jgi:hypothetical protein
MLGEQPGIVDMCLTCVMRLPHHYQEEKQFDIMVVVSDILFLYFNNF